ncbi:MAG TPA: thiol-disulfide oxidoreductase [Lysinibacillus sp.]|jgi:thiol-disulfide isomerase/thioredoxin|uniref:Thiol-disulfide oxidoreductase n=1 Tax=Lysinibacillus fusiformis TaxID=28031 RepID=A0A2I0V5U3_9BACI|nr:MULTISPECIES: redoxin domain-containing protein [Lysinibacillus]HBT72312.1 thiol-disulfide oxidoreductase [Lysinibacillus sp.]KUF35272.1 thiol-disulfide oxidoreductase [Lysinibacillus sp. F5]PKU53592.1 thiol-disulfide oxidoreductase [Lysinibacillus fusiformis]WCH48447.1 redoxin domain-containing protein [Lysinibacillus sp. OF-1]SCZ08179.1 Peroxiredoxin [Lysinibacillus sp. SG9]
MKKNIGLLIVVLLVIAMIGTYVRQQINEERAIEKSALGKDMEELETGLKKGDIPPDFTLTSLDGEDITLSDLRGKKVVLNFWATWCPPCKAEMPHMQSFYDEYAKEKNVEIIAVNLTSAERDVTADAKVDTVMTFRDSFELTFPILLDPDNDAGLDYQIITIPTTYFIDSNGYIQRAIRGPMDVDMLNDYVDALD